MPPTCTAAGDRLLGQQLVPDLDTLHIGGRVEAHRLSPAARGEGATDLVRVGRSVDARGTAHGADEGHVQPACRPEEAGDRTGGASVAHRHHAAVVEAPLQIPGGSLGDGLALRLRVGARRADDRVAQAEGLAELALELQPEPGGRLDVDGHDTGAARAVQQALDLGPGEGKFAGDLLLSALVHVVPMGQPSQELVVVLTQFLAKLLPHAPTTPSTVSKCSPMHRLSVAARADASTSRVAPASGEG